MGFEGPKPPGPREDDFTPEQEKALIERIANFDRDLREKALEWRLRNRAIDPQFAEEAYFRVAQASAAWSDFVCELVGIDRKKVSEIADRPKKPGSE